jgi:hypothetical protein
MNLGSRGSGLSNFHTIISPLLTLATGLFSKLHNGTFTKASEEYPPVNYKATEDEEKSKGHVSEPIRVTTREGWKSGE